MTSERLTKSLLLFATFGGALFCLLNASGAHLLCITEGCRIYSGYGFFGISFYVYGAIAFGLLFLLALIYPHLLSRLLLPAALLVILVLDTLFLIYQSLFWPCMSCLAVAFLFGLAILAGLHTFNPAGRQIVLAVGLVWLCFFAFLGISTMKEIVFRPWPIYGAADAPTQVYFSPECPACRKIVRDLLAAPDAAANTAFFPVAKNQEDIRQLARFAALTEGREIDQATFLSLFADTPQGDPPPPQNWRLRLHLLANKINLARLGVASVPLIVTPQLPQLPPASFDQNIFSPPAATSPLEGCSAFEEKACD